MFKWIAIALALLAGPAQAQQWIQIPSCGGPVPANVNPSAATITVNPSGQLCVLTGTITVSVPTPTVSIPSPQAVVIYSGNDVTEGVTTDVVTVAPSNASTVISLLKGILSNVLSPINVTGNLSTTVSSPIGVNIAATTPINVTMASPINVTGNFSSTPASPQNTNMVQIDGQQVASPSTYGAAPVGSVQGVNAFITNNVSVTPPTPLQITLPASPIGVAIVSSPVNVTGNFSTTQTGTNLVQIDGQQIASPSTYGVAPVGSVQGVNAFVTSLPATPLNVTVGNVVSPAGVAVVNNVVVTTPTPLQVTLPASPISVGIAGPTPLNVTVGGIVSPQNVTVATSPLNTNLVQVQGTSVASPSTYGAAPVGSVQGVNAFVTNNVNVTPPTPLQVTLPASPVSVGVNNNVSVTPPTPLQITLPASPISVGIAGPTPLNVTVGGIVSPQNVTLATSPVANNFVQLQGVNIASPSTYGIAPVGSTQGVNAFVTNNVNVTPPTPLQVTLPASPIGVQILTNPGGVGSPVYATPLNVTLAASPLNVTTSSPQAQNLVQVQNVNIASPSTYGVAPVGSTAGFNAFVTNGNPNGSATSANSQPVVVANDQTPVKVVLATGGSTQTVTLSGSPVSVGLATPPSVYLSLPIPANLIAYTVTEFSLTAAAVSNTVIALGATPGISGIHQLAKAICNVQATAATPAVGYLQMFDATPHASGSDVTLGTTIPNQIVAISSSPQVPNNWFSLPPGEQYSHGITVAYTTTARNASPVGVGLACTFAYN